MTRTIAWTLFTAVALAPLAVGAQTPATSPTTTNPTSSTAAYATEKNSDSKRVTGCIVAGTNGTFTFTESAMTTSPVTAGDTSATTAPSAAPSTPSWMLMANTDVDLSKYAGQQVELTGSSDHKGGMSADKTQSTTRSSNSTTGPRFHVKSVKVLAATCS